MDKHDPFCLCEIWKTNWSLFVTNQNSKSGNDWTGKKRVKNKPLGKNRKPCNIWLLVMLNQIAKWFK